MIKINQGKVTLGDKSKSEFNEIQTELKEKISQLRSYGKKGMLTSLVKSTINDIDDDDKIITTLLELQVESYKTFSTISDYEKWRKKTYKELIKADEEIRKRYVFKSIGTIVMFLSFIIIALILNKYEFFKFGDKENTSKYFTLIILGIAGSILHFNIGENVSKDKSIRGKYRNEVFARLVVTLIFPIVIVVLLYNTESDKLTFKLNAETWSFLIGYSSTLVSKLLSKLVGLAEKMVDLIG